MYINNHFLIIIYLLELGYDKDYLYLNSEEENDMKVIPEM